MDKTLKKYFSELGKKGNKARNEKLTPAERTAICEEGSGSSAGEAGEEEGRQGTVKYPIAIIVLLFAALAGAQETKYVPTIAQ